MHFPPPDTETYSSPVVVVVGTAVVVAAALVVPAAVVVTSLGAVVVAQRWHNSVIDVVEPTSLVSSSLNFKTLVGVRKHPAVWADLVIVSGTVSDAPAKEAATPHVVASSITQ